MAGSKQIVCLCFSILVCFLHNRLVQDFDFDRSRAVRVQIVMGRRIDGKAQMPLVWSYKDPRADDDAVLHVIKTADQVDMLLETHELIMRKQPGMWADTKESTKELWRMLENCHPVITVEGSFDFE
jgi:hypothetical protein